MQTVEFPRDGLHTCGQDSLGGEPLPFPAAGRKSSLPLSQLFSGLDDDRLGCTLRWPAGSGKGEMWQGSGGGRSAGSEVQVEAFRLALKAEGSAVCPAAPPLTQVTPVAWLQRAMADGDVVLLLLFPPQMLRRRRDGPAYLFEPWPCMLWLGRLSAHGEV